MSTTTERQQQHHRPRQQPDAAARSLEVRRRRAQARREIREMVPWEKGQMLLGKLLVQCPDWLASIPVHVVICWAPFVGDRVGHALLIHADVHGVKRLSQLSPRQRRVLARLLGYNDGPLA